MPSIVSTESSMSPNTGIENHEFPEFAWRRGKSRHALTAQRHQTFKTGRKKSAGGFFGGMPSIGIKVPGQLPVSSTQCFLIINLIKVFNRFTILCRMNDCSSPPGCDSVIVTPGQYTMNSLPSDPPAHSIR
jgi:hypothetical protein